MLEANMPRVKNLNKYKIIHCLYGVLSLKRRDNT